jgi:F420-0:gamma-glutamyl ligase
LVKLPEYVGPHAFGVKMGVIVPGMDIVQTVFEQLAHCHRDGLLENGDIICVTESVVARAQNNYVTTADVAGEIREKLHLEPGSRLGVVFPIASRNRFALVLRGFALALPEGEVIMQLTFPCDEVGNRVIDPEFAGSLGKDLITLEDLAGRKFPHPVTGIDYISFYREIISAAGAAPQIILCNDPLRILDYRPDGVVAADIHSRAKTRAIIGARHPRCITLDEICNSGEAYSEWGLLGSNISAGEKIKLAPRDGSKIVGELQRLIRERLGVQAEVMIYGDGAYRDPTTGIYELADPRPAFAATDGLNRYREGLKYKYLADYYFHEEGKSAAEIERLLQEKRENPPAGGGKEAREGTTPRRMEDVIASLADLVSGSSDAGTPLVIVKGF